MLQYIIFLLFHATTLSVSRKGAKVKDKDAKEKTISLRLCVFFASLRETSQQTIFAI
jgi:hypothetical protein